MSDLKPSWFPVLKNQEYFDYLREEYPENKDLTNSELESEYILISKYVTLWDTLGGAYHDYEQLADAYLELENKRDDGWISVAKEMPKHGQSVICFYINSHGNKRMVIGHYFHRWTEESSCDDDCCHEYSEERDEYYYKEGWYEQQENWGDYASIFIHEGEVTYWKKRPKFPEVG